MVKVLDCGIIVSEFKLQLHYYINFWTNTHWERYEPSYSPCYGLNMLQDEILPWFEKNKKKEKKKRKKNGS